VTITDVAHRTRGTTMIAPLTNWIALIACAFFPAADARCKRECRRVRTQLNGANGDIPIP
jgi:hypothetical protein